MIAAVIPSQNEGANIKDVLQTLACSQVDLIVPILNGCTDNTREILERFSKKKLYTLDFCKPLGIDVPRSIGAKVALELGADAVVFVDGDMKGPILKQINELIEAVTSGQMDMGLTNCYQAYYSMGELAQLVLHFRKTLSQELALYDQIGVASPCHGPHAVNRRFLSIIPLNELAIPPVSLAVAVNSGLMVGVATATSHALLGSALRHPSHGEKIAETIIGDCIEALEFINDKPRTRRFGERVFTGYNEERDFLTLHDFLCK